MFSAARAEVESDENVVGTHGWYATFDQTLWQGALPDGGVSGNPPTIAAFAQVGRADERVQAVHTHGGGGLTFVGLLAFRPADITGLGVPHAGWTGGREVISEMFYQLPVFSQLWLVADVQHVSRRDLGLPSKTGTVATMRTIISF